MAKKPKTSSTSNTWKSSRGMSAEDAHSLFTSIQSGINNLRQQKTARDEYEEYLRYKQQEQINKVTSPDSYINSAGLENRQDVQDFQNNAYGELDENLRNDLTDLNKRNEVYDLTGIQNINPLDTQIADEDSGLQNLLPWNLAKNVKKAFDAKEEQKQSIADEYGLNSTYDVEDLAEVGRRVDAKNEFKAKATQQYNLQDGYYDQKKDTSRNYQQEINYANKYLSNLTDDTDAVRNAVSAYLEADDRANEAQAGASAEAMSGNTTAQEQAEYLRYTATQKANAIKQQYGITDDKEFKKLVQYVQELNDYDDAQARQEDAYKSVHTGSVGKNLVNATANTIRSAANLIPGAAGAALATLDYYANGYADKNAPININSKAYEMQNERDDYRAATQSAASEVNPVLGYGYGIASSVLDNVVTGAAGKLVGDVVGGTAIRNAVLAGKSYEDAAKAAKGITEIAEQVGNLTPFFGTAFASTLADRVENGDYMDVALSKAIRDGSVETLTEIGPNVSLYDMIRKGGKGGQSFAEQVVKNLAKQFKEEGMEEIEGDILTLFLDRAQYGNNSEFDQMVKSYINDGHSRKDALGLAAFDELKQIALDGLSGGIAGAIGGVGATAVGTIEARNNANNMFGDFTAQDYADFAEGLDVGTADTNADTEGAHEYESSAAQQSMQRAKDLATRMSQQETVSDNDRLELWSAYNTALQDEQTAQEERAEAEEKAAKKAAKEQKEWQAHEDLVDAYNEAHGIQTEEQTVDQSIQQDIPEDLRAESNNSTAGDVHTAMAQAKTSEELYAAVQKGLNSTNENTRKQTLSNLDNLTAMLEGKGVATEAEIQAFKQTDAQIYQAGYTGEEITTATTRQKQIYNAGQQAAIKVKAENNLAQRELMTKQVQSIRSEALRDIVTSHYETGYNATAYTNFASAIEAGARNGMSLEDTVKAAETSMLGVGGDVSALRTTGEKIFNFAQEQAKNETIAEIAKSMKLQRNVASFGTGAFVDNRSNTDKPIAGENVYRMLSKITGLNVVIYDGRSDQSKYQTATIAGSNGAFRTSESTIFVNADRAERMASAVFHELGEFASVYSPEEFQKFSMALNSAMLKAMGSHAYNEMRRKYADAYIKQTKKSDVDLDKEMTCDMLYQFLGSKEGMQKLIDEINAGNTVEEATTIKQKLADWIKKLANTLTDLFSGFKPSSYQRRVADAQIAQMNELSDMLTKSIADAVRNYQQAAAAGNVVSEATSEDRTSEAIKAGKGTIDDYGEIDNGTLRLSEATYEDGGRKFLEDYLSRAEDLSQEQKDDIIDRLDWAYKIVKDLSRSEFQYYSGWAGTKLTTDPVTGNPLITMNAPGNKPIKSVAVNNGEYPLNIDFSQICKKRMTLNAVINSLVEDYGLNLPTLTESDINTINQTIKEHGYEIACGLCFVDAKRYRVGKWAESFTGEYDVTPKKAKKGWNDVVQMLRPVDKNSNAGFSYFNYATDIPNTTTAERTMDQLSDDEIDRSALEKMIGKFAIHDENENVLRDENGNLLGISGYKQKNTGKRRNPTEQIKMAWEIYSNPSMRKMLSKDDLISSDGLDAIREQNPALYSLVNAHWGAGKPKLPHGATAYGNEILRSSTWGSKNNFDPETAKMVGGVRVQSFSDYEANMFFDYCQLFADMAARKLTSHGYTKETDYVRLFGMTGQKINMSIVAKAANLTDEQKARYNKFRSQENMLKDAEFAKIYETSGFDTDSINAWAEKNGMSGKPIREIANAMVDAGVSIKDILLVEDETFNLDDALELQKDERYADNCGIIWIGVSDEQIKFMLDSDDVPMVIPYHSSGVSAFIKKERNLLLYKDYQNDQTTKGTNGKALPTGKEFDFYKSLYETNDPKATADEYLAWCEENGYTPKFNIPGIVDHPNYYKLLIDFKVYDYNGVDPALAANRRYLPQQEIRMAFPENTNEIVVDSLKRQQSTMDKLNADFANQNDGILSELSEKLGLTDGDRMSEDVDDSVDPRKDMRTADLTYADGVKRVDITADDLNRNAKSIRESNAIGKYSFHTDKYSGLSRMGKMSMLAALKRINGGKEFIVNDSVGEIPISNKGIGSILSHSNTDEKSLFLETFPDVIKHGMIISGDQNHAGKIGKNSIVIAAKVTMEGESGIEGIDPGDYYVAVALRRIASDAGRVTQRLHAADFVTEKIERANNGRGNFVEINKSLSSYDYLDLHDILRNVGAGVNIYDSDDTSQRLSLDVEDSDGNELTPAQREYFKDSKAVDENGRLKVMLHGTTSAGFTVFDPSKSDDGISLFFTDHPYIAGTYSDRWDVYAPSATDGVPESRQANYQVYLDLKNPMVVDYDGRYWNDGEMRNRKDVSNAAKKADKAIQAAGVGVDLEYLVDSWRTRDNMMHTFDAFVKNFLGDHIAADDYKAVQFVSDLFENELYSMVTSDVAVAADLTDTLFDGMIPSNTRDYAREAKAKGYDGVIFKNVVDEGPFSDRWADMPSTVMVAFNSNQVKSINNENPTEDVDIRRSMNLDDNRNMNNEEISANRDEIASVLEQGKELLKGTKVNKQAVQNIVMEEKRKFGSAVDTAEFTDNLTKLFAYLHNGKSINYNDFVAVMQDVARPAIDAAYTTQASREDFAQFRNAIDGMTFSISAEQRKAISDAFGSMKVFERYYPEIHITDDAQSISDQWSTLVDLSRGLLDENVDAADMPTALVDAMEALRPSMNNWEDNTQAAHDMALDIIAKYLGNYHDAGANKAVINEFTKSAEKQIKAKQKEWKDKVKADYNERLKAERAYQKEIANERVAKANERSAEQIARLRAKNATRIGDIRERQKRNAQLRQINKSASRLHQYLTNPTDQNHIPKILQEPVMQLMLSLDMSQPNIRQGEDGKWHTRILAGRSVDEATGRYVYEWKDITADTREEAIQQYNEALANGFGSQGARKWYDRMQEIADMYSKQSGDNAFADGNSQEMMEFLQGLAPELAADFDKILKDASKNGTASMAALNSDDLKTINAVLKNVLQSVNMINKSYSNPSKKISDMAEGTIAKANRVVGRKNHDIAVEQAINFATLSNANMHTFLHAIGADGLIDVLITAQNKKATILKEAQEASAELFKGYSVKELETMEKDATEYLGGKVKLTTFQVMDLRELLMRPDAATHFAGGIKAGKIGRMTNTESVARHLTMDEAWSIANTLSEKNRNLSDGLQKLMAKIGSTYGNEASNLLSGFDKFTDEHYITMNTDSTTHKASTSELLGGVANSIKNMGMTKAVTGNANNALVIDNLSDVYAKHIADMATYSAWAPAIQDLIRFYNYKQVVYNEDGSVDYYTTKDAIRRMFGDGGLEYFTKMVSDLQYAEQSSFEDPGIWSVMVGNAKKAAVMANMRVAIQQPTAIFRAGKRISYKYLNKGIAGFTGELESLRKQMIDSNAVYWIKNNGNIDGQITQSLKAQITGVQTLSEKIADKTGWLAGKADQVTWDAMYRAVIAEQIDKMGRDKIGTKEFQDAVNYKFDHLMLETQVYDGTITRSQFMRSADTYMKQASAFMAEPTKTYNLVLSDVIDYLQTGNDESARRAAKAALGVTAKVLIITSVVNSFAQSFWDAIRNAGDPDDEDDLNFVQRFWEAMGWDYDAETWQDKSYAVLHGNLADNLNLLDNIPIVNDNVESIDNIIWGLLGAETSSYSSSDSLDSQWLTHLDDWLSATKDLFADKETKDKSTKTGYSYLSKAARLISDLTGIPVYAAQRDIVAVYNTLIARNSNGALPVLLKTKTSNMKQTKSDVYSLARDGASYEEITAAIDKAVNTSNSYEGIRNGIKTALKDEFVALYKADRSAAGQMKTRIAQIYVYIAKKEGTYADKSDSQKLEIYKKNIDKWLEE